MAARALYLIQMPAPRPGVREMSDYTELVWALSVEEAFGIWLAETYHVEKSWTHDNTELPAGHASSTSPFDWRPKMFGRAAATRVAWEGQDYPGRSMSVSFWRLTPANHGLATTDAPAGELPLATTAARFRRLVELGYRPGGGALPEPVNMDDAHELTTVEDEEQ